MRKLQAMCAAAVFSLVALPAFAGDTGTPAEAKAMLEKVAAAMKGNEAQTLTAINKGEYKDRDLYPFCGDPTASIRHMAQIPRSWDRISRG